MKTWTSNDVAAGGRFEATTSGTTEWKLNFRHHLGRVPRGFSVALVCQTAEYGYAVGDVVTIGPYANSVADGSPSIGFYMHDATDAAFDLTFMAQSRWDRNSAKHNQFMRLRVPIKNGAGTFVPSTSRWKVRVSVWG